MLKVTRLYTKKDKKAVNKQAFFLAPGAVESVRPSTVLTGQKATIRTFSGMEVPVAETKEAVLAAQKAAFKEMAAITTATVRSSRY